MNTYKIYKAVKEQLNTIAPVMMYLGQYLKSVDNTSYKVPAVYIEMPKNLQLQYFGKIQVAKNATIRIHYISNAPYKNSDNGVQDSALSAHQSVISAIDKLLNGFVARDTNNKMLTQQLITTDANILNFDSLHVYSVLTYGTEFISRHLQ